MKIQGYIRFSYLGLNDTKLAHRLVGDPQAHFRELFDPLRMARRFHFFERLCLPALRHQTDQDFSVVIAASDVMPQHYKDRLEEAVSGLEQVSICFSDRPTVGEAIDPVIRDLVDTADGPVLQFRLDDDDALGAGAIKSLKSMGERAEPGAILTLPRGYKLFLRDGVPYLYEQHEPFIGLGWTRVSAAGDYRSPFHFGHFGAARRFPSMADPRQVGWVHVLHSASDTATQNAARIERMADRHAEKVDPKHLRALTDSVNAAFPAIGFEGFYDAILTAPESEDAIGLFHANTT